MIKREIITIFFYNENNINYNNLINGSNIMISTSTQTNLYKSEDEDEN